MARVTVTLPPSCDAKDVYFEKLFQGWDVYCGDDKLNSFVVATLENAAEFVMLYYHVSEIRLNVNGKDS